MAPWLEPEELRVGLGCMRFAEERRAHEVIRAAVDAGVTVFDTARAYGESERWLGAALKGAGRAPRIITKGGMKRPQGRWMPDGRGVAIARIPFQRRPTSGAPARLIALDAFLAHPSALTPAQPTLVFGWKPDGAPPPPIPGARALHCPHPAGPPTCWCRPPLPGLPLLFAREADVDLSRSVLVGTGSAHRSLAAALGCSYEEI